MTDEDERFWEQARLHPTMATELPFFGILILEAPERWLAFQREHAEGWIGSHIGLLPDTSLRLFVADCVERVLPLYESVMSDERPRHAVAVARDFACGKATADTLEDARIVVGNLSHAMWTPDCVLRAALHLCGRPYSFERTLNRTGSAKRAISESLNAVDSKTGGIRREEEASWQWRRLLEYFTQENV